MKKILLIEDNLGIRETTAEILELAGYDVDTVENGKEGVRYVNANHPDLIICDIMMPELDGYGVLHILGKNPDTASIPFIFLTAKTEKVDLRKGMNLGADDYLTKPYDSTELLDAVEIRLKKNEAIKQEFTKNIEGLNNFLDKASEYQELKDLSKDRVLKRYVKKQFLFMEGNPTHQFYFVHSGKVKTIKDNVDGKEFVTGIHEAGDFIGYLPLLGNISVHNESAKVIDDAEICIIPEEDLFKLMHGNEKVSQQFIKILSNNLMDRENEIVHIAYDSVRQRVAQTLLDLYNSNHGDENKSCVGIEITREDLAGLIGIAKETVTRTLSDFKSEGAIEIERKLITVKDKDKLIQLTL